MGNNVLGYPRKLMSDEDKFIRTVKGLLADGSLVASTVADDDYGDVRVSGSGANWTVESVAGTIYLQNTATTAEIQAALDSLTSGGTVVLEQGSYVLTATLYLSHPALTLRGSGKGNTVLYYTADRNTDIIVIEHSYCTVEHMTISGTSPALVNGGGAAGTGRGIVFAQPNSSTNFANPTYSSTLGPGGQCTFPTVRSVTVTNTASWGIYDSGLKNFTTTSNNWTSPLSNTNFCLSVLALFDDVDVSFWASNGAVFIGSSASTPVFRGLKTNGYSYNTFTQVTGSGAVPVNDMGGVFLYNVFGATFDAKCYLQSPTDGGILDDKDATLLSFLNCISCTMEGVKFEILSGTTADSNQGAGGRQYYFITAANSHALYFSKCHFQSYMPDGGSTLSNFGLKVFRSAAPPSTVGAIFDGGYATHQRTTLGAPSGARDTGEPTTWDRNDFVFAGDGDGNTSVGVGGSECGVFDFVISNTTTGKFREATTPIDAFTVANCTTGGVPSTTVTTSASFVNVNRGDLVSGTGVTAGTLVQYVTALGTIILDQNATVPAATTLTFTPYGKDAIRRPGFHWRDKRGPIRFGHFTGCDLTFAGDNNDFAARWSLSHQTYDGVLAYIRSGTLDEGLWLGNANDGLPRQIPMYRRRASFWSSPKQGDMNYLTSDESFYTYNSTAAAWQSYLKRGLGTAAGDLIYYTASDTPARLAHPAALGKFLKSATGPNAPAWGDLSLSAVSLTAQVADIATTNLSASPTAGSYMVEAYILCTTADAAAGTLTLTIGWTDDVGATTDTTVTLALTATGRARAMIPIRVASSNVTYAVANGGIYGTAAYALYLRNVPLG